jgi:hypothetical protein
LCGLQERKSALIYVRPIHPQGLLCLTLCITQSPRRLFDGFTRADIDSPKCAETSSLKPSLRLVPKHAFTQGVRSGVHGRHG